jgi:hypothetical protein
MSVLATLINSLDDDHGVSESTYEEILNFVRFTHGDEAVTILNNSVDATEGRYYISEGYAGDLISEIESCKV